MISTFRTGDEQGSAGASNERRGKKRRMPYNENGRFCQEFDGITTVTQRGAERVQEICENMVGWDKGSFPGSQPVSLDRQNIELLSQRPYRLTWKADGTR